LDRIVLGAVPTGGDRDAVDARIHAIVRRSKGHAQSVIQTGGLVVNLDTKTVEVNGSRVHLTGNDVFICKLRKKLAN
jgi:two-component system cell cycle response regulator CtrA